MNYQNKIKNVNVKINDNKELVKKHTLEMGMEYFLNSEKSLEIEEISNTEEKDASYDIHNLKNTEEKINKDEMLDKLNLLLKYSARLKQKENLLTKNQALLKELQKVKLDLSEKKTEIKSTLNSLEKEKDPDYILFSEYLIKNEPELLETCSEEIKNLYKKILTSIETVEKLKEEKEGGIEFINKIGKQINLIRASGIENHLSTEQKKLGKEVYKKLAEEGTLVDYEHRNFISSLLEIKAREESLKQELEKLDLAETENKKKIMDITSGKTLHIYNLYAKKELEKTKKELDEAYYLLGLNTEELISSGEDNFSAKVKEIYSNIKEIKEKIDNYIDISNRLEAGLKVEAIQKNIEKKRGIITSNNTTIENKKQENLLLEGEIKNYEGELNLWIEKRGDDKDLEKF